MPDTISDEYVRRSLTLLRAAEGEAIDVAQRLRKVHESIVSDVSQVFADATPVRRRKKLAGLRVKVENALDKFYSDEWPDELKDIEVEVIQREVAWNKKTLSAVTESTLVAPRSMNVIVAARSQPYQGKTFDKWIGAVFPEQKHRVDLALMNGFTDGKSVQEMVRDITNITNRADRDVRTITRSFFMHNAVEAKESVYNLNPDVVEGKIWVSTLDGRTTPLICGVRDQLEYTVNGEPIDHGYEWDAGPGRIHWNCRSTSIPKIKGVSQPSSPRPSIAPGKEYTRGDNVTRTGRVRKPHKAAKEKGIYKVQQRTTRTRYEGWLKEQSKSNIDFVADVLGSKDKARAFRDGETTLSQLNALSPVASPLTRTQI